MGNAQPHDVDIYEQFLSYRFWLTSTLVACKPEVLTQTKRHKVSWFVPNSYSAVRSRLNDEYDPLCVYYDMRLPYGRHVSPLYLPSWIPWVWRSYCHPDSKSSRLPKSGDNYTNYGGMWNSLEQQNQYVHSNAYNCRSICNTYIVLELKKYSTRNDYVNKSKSTLSETSINGLLRVEFLRRPGMKFNRGLLDQDFAEATGMWVALMGISCIAKAGFVIELSRKAIPCHLASKRKNLLFSRLYTYCSNSTRLSVLVHRIAQCKWVCMTMRGIQKYK